MIRLVQLFVGMDQRNLIDPGVLPSTFPALRKQHPETRTPWHHAHNAAL